MHPERRRKRSSYFSLALQYWLSAVAQRKRQMAMVLADSAGLLVASSFKGPEAEELAAMAPLLSAPGGPDAPLTDAPRLPYQVHRMAIDRTSLFLCAVGDRPGRDEALRLAESGVRRILTTH